MIITKADGTTEEFDAGKLVISLRRSGATEHIAQQITKDVEKELWGGISTQEIYSRAFEILRNERRGMAARYSLKRALLAFGPTGFPFEAYIAELFRAEGHESKVDQIIQGKCVEHEVDVVVKKNSETVYAEAKFHNTLGLRTDLKVVLYVTARIEDIKSNDTSARGLVVTNTKFSSQAISYSKCHALELLGWDYPHTNTLQDRIGKASLYPITALTSLSQREKTALLKDKIVLCNTLSEDTGVLAGVGVSGGKADRVLEEVGALCIPKNEVL